MKLKHTTLLTKETLFKGLFAVLTPLAIGATLNASVAFAAPGKPLSDEWIEARAEGAIAYNTYLDSSDISVDVSKGQAILSGTVPSETERDLAQQITASIDGVSTIENRIKVDPEVAPRSRPASSQRIIDATTTAAVKTRLLANKTMRDMEVQISTKEGIVTLTGTVGSLAQKEVAERVTYNTRDVRDVQNDLKVADAVTMREKANNASVNVGNEVSDSWVSSKIRASLLFSSDFPGSNVNVRTEKGVVTLEGHARTTTQRDEIGRMVNDFVGVRTVENNLKLKQG